MLNIIIWVSIILIIAILFAIFRAYSLVQIIKDKNKKEDDLGKSNNINAFLFIVFLIAGFGTMFWYSISEFDKYTVPVASEHGEITFVMFWITMAITMFVIVGTHVVMFYFAYKYKYNKNHVAHYYPHNNMLEMIWTIIPAIVLTLLIFSGWKSWVNITGPAPAEAEVLEIVGYQYAWASRYPGKDKKLGKFNYQLIDDENRLGIDFSDPFSKDDFFPREIHIPKGKPVLFKIRARDVIHSVYAPHFRLQMNAVPGMPTKFWFVPTKSTADMREETKNPDFQYELVCNKICGKGHFAMRYIIIVEEPDEYEQWYISQESWLSKNPDYLTFIEAESPVNATGVSKVSKTNHLQ